MSGYNSFIKTWAREHAEMEQFAVAGICITLPIVFGCISSVNQYCYWAALCLSVWLSVCAWVYMLVSLFHMFAKDSLYEAHLVPRFKYSTLARIEFLIAFILFASAISMASSITSKNCLMPGMKAPADGGGPCLCLKLEDGTIKATGCSRTDPGRQPPLITSKDGGALGVACAFSFLSALAFLFKGMFSFSQEIKGDGLGNEYYANVDTSYQPYNLAYNEIQTDSDQVDL
jgi:hypothetical protein